MHCLTPAQLTARLRRMPLQRVRSSAVRKLGFDPEARMAGVQFTDNETLYGYPNLTDEEVRGLLQAMEDPAHHSLGHYVSAVIKARHDHEHLRLDDAL